MATANLFVDWSSFNNPPWQANNGIAIAAGQTTVYDLFSAAGVTPTYAIASQGSGANLYVTAIDGVAQNANNNGYWWVYFINGNMGTVGCGSQTLNDGDSVAWDYKHFSSGLKQANHPGLAEDASPTS